MRGSENLITKKSCNAKRTWILDWRKKLFLANYVEEANGTGSYGL